MKKLLFSALVLSLVVTSCKKDDDVSNIFEAFDCLQGTEDASDAADAYSNDPSNANCITYRDSLQSLLDQGCLGNNTASTQASIDALPCN